MFINAKPWDWEGRRGTKLSPDQDDGANGSENREVSEHPSNPATSTSPSPRTESSHSLSSQLSPLSSHILWSPRLPISSLSTEGVPSSHEVLHHFTTATALTCGNSKSQVIAQSEVVSSALSTPYLMHAILGLAAAHIRCLMPGDTQVSSAKLKVAECFYWAKALEGFRRELAGSALAPAHLVPCRSNVTKRNMDQLLSTVMFVSMHQFSLRDDSGAVAHEGCAPRSFVWLPDRSARDTALKWLGIQAGFKGLLQAMGPWLSESFWLPIIGSVDFVDEFNLKDLGAVSGDKGSDPVESHFVKLCRVGMGSVDENPYAVNLEIVLWCRRMRPINAETFTKLLNFVARMTPQFQGLLLDLDTAALLILAHWLLLMLGVGQWWITSRCLVEIREIVRFVRQHNAMAKAGESVDILLREPAAAIVMEI